jgi:hypothetical protein
VVVGNRRADQTKSCALHAGTYFVYSFINQQQSTAAAEGKAETKTEKQRERETKKILLTN